MGLKKDWKLPLVEIDAVVVDSKQGSCQVQLATEV